MTRISDKFEFLKSSNIPASSGKSEGAYPFYTSSKTQSKFIDEYQYDGESIILGTGGSPNIHFQNKKFSVSSDCVVLQSKTYSVKLLYFYLYGNIHLLHKGFQGAGLQHISKRFIQAIEIPEFDNNVQKEIVATLDKVQVLIEKRKKTLELLDDILRSVFLDNFWTLSPNFNNWPETKLKDVLIKNGSRTGPFGSALLKEEMSSEGEIAVLGIDNAVANSFQWNEKRFISRSKYESLKQYRVLPRDIIVTIMGTVGRTAIIPENIPLAINTKHLAKLTVNNRKCNPYYLAYAIHSDPYIKFQIQHQKRGAIMDGVNLKIIRNLKFRLPPIKSQNKFERTYKVIEKSKEQRQRSLQIIENLFKSLIKDIFTHSKISRPNELEKYLKDKVLQIELYGKLKTQDFSHHDEYHKAKNILFELLDSDSSDSLLIQKYNATSDKIELIIK